MFAFLGDLVYRRRRLVLVVTGLFVVVAAGLGGPVATILTSGTNTFEDPATESVKARNILAHATGANPQVTLTALVRPEKRSIIPSVTHVDGSARPQTVEKEINPLYWGLIDEFEKRTGVPVIMNTSFNLRGEAIVHTPTDAIRTFFSSGMDALVIGSFLVEK